MFRSVSALGLALATALTMAVGAPPAAAANLLVNPGFEDGGGSYNGWFTFGAGVQLSVAAGDSIVRTGVEASKIYGEFTGCPIPNFDVGGYGQAITPTPGQDYVFSGWSYVSNADPIPGTVTCEFNRCIAKIVFFNAASGGAEISSNEIVIGDGTTPLDQWIPFSVTAPAPAGALRAEALILYLQPGCDPGAVFVDDLSLEAVTPVTTPNLLANPSFDTDLSGWTVFGNALYEGRGNTLPDYVFARRTPPGSVKMYSTFVLGSDSGLYQGFPAAPGSEWELTGYSLTSCGEDPIDGASDNFAIAKIVFLDGSIPPVEINAFEETIVDASSPQGTWTKHRVVAVAPPGTVTVRAYFLFVSPSLLPDDACFLDDASFRQTVVTDVPSIAGADALELRQNVPNPFVESTRIDFVIDRKDAVKLGVYDIAGRLVTTLIDRTLAPGPHTATWNGRLADGSPAAAGVYHYVLTTSEGRTAKRMMRLR